MRYPVNYINITTPFTKGKHYGIDLGWGNECGKNQPIYAVEDGVVIYKTIQTSGGKVLHIRHNNGYVSEYAHLDRWEVNKGDRVSKGQLIGFMGCTGQAKGNHCHFGLYKGTSINYKDLSKFVNPIDHLTRTSEQIVNDKTKANYSIKEETKEDWSIGQYELLVSKAIRTSHELTNNIVKVGKCMSSVRANLTSTNSNDDAYYKIGTIVDITEIYIDNENRVWGKLQNCWIVLCNKDGTPQAKRR